MPLKNNMCKLHKCYIGLGSVIVALFGWNWPNISHAVDQIQEVMVVGESISQIKDDINELKQQRQIEQITTQVQQNSLRDSIQADQELLRREVEISNQSTNEKLDLIIRMFSQTR